MHLDLQKMKDLLPPLSKQEEATCDLWVKGVEEFLAATYPIEKLDRLESFVTGYVIDALKRRLSNPNPSVIREGAGPFSVGYSEHFARGGFFLPEEKADLDRVLGRSGTRSYRTPAPEEIIQLNRMPRVEEEELWHIQ
ncbi:hypothetical protein VVR12_01790 [Rothia sp. LK2588]|uniref:hypothetical protein n=1 Tax=Rothia sp. LK2588 TaxID=3114369 RepID=UPI0034CF3C3D